MKQHCLHTMRIDAYGVSRKKHVYEWKAQHSDVESAASISYLNFEWNKKSHLFWTWNSMLFSHDIQMQYVN